MLNKYFFVFYAIFYPFRPEHKFQRVLAEEISNYTFLSAKYLKF